MITATTGLSALDTDTAEDTWDDVVLDEATLTRLALAADRDEPLAPDAIPMASYLAEIGVTSGCDCGLPAWYMPAAPIVRGRGRVWRAMFVIPIVMAFLMIGAFGLCNCYGLLGFA